MRLTCSLLRTWGGKGRVRSAVRRCPIDATNEFDIYSVQQRKDVKCFTLLGDYARPAGTEIVCVSG